MDTKPINVSSKADIKILVVDDREDNLFSIEAILEKDNYTIVKATSGRAALKMLEEYSFDLIFMDVQMPEMDGFEATALIRQNEKSTGRHIPIVAMTAHAMAGDRERCIQAGMDGYLPKPITASGLLDLVAHHCGKTIAVPASLSHRSGPRSDAGKSGVALNA